MTAADGDDQLLRYNLMALEPILDDQLLDTFLGPRGAFGIARDGSVYHRSADVQSLGNAMFRGREGVGIAGNWLGS